MKLCKLAFSPVLQKHNCCLGQDKNKLGIKKMTKPMHMVTLTEHHRKRTATLYGYMTRKARILHVNIRDINANMPCRCNKIGMIKKLIGM